MSKFMAFATTLFLLVAAPSHAQVCSPEILISEGTNLINEMLPALRLEDEKASKEALIPLLHTVNLDDFGDLTRDNLAFVFPRARRASHRYEHPVIVTRTRESIITYVNNETGLEYDIFIAKNANYKGMPAPVKVFCNAETGKISISYIGSL